MPLKFHYFKNPFGKGVSTGSANTITEVYAKRYFEAIEKDIEYDISLDEKTGEYIFKFLLPSEENPEYTKKLFYDVVFSVTPVIKEMINTTTTINDYDIRVFSNQIAFIYSYTHALRNPKIDGLIKWMPTRFYDRDAYNTPSKIRNPNEDLYFDKGIWYCMFCMKKNRLNEKKILHSVLTKRVTRRYVLDNIMSQTAKKEQRVYYDKNLKIKKEKDVERGYDKQKYEGIRNKREYLKNEEKMKAQMKAETKMKNMRADMKPKVKNPGRNKPVPNPLAVKKKKK